MQFLLRNELVWMDQTIFVEKFGFVYIEFIHCSFTYRSRVKMPPHKQIKSLNSRCSTFIFSIIHTTALSKFKKEISTTANSLPHWYLQAIYYVRFYIFTWEKREQLCSGLEVYFLYTGWWPTNNFVPRFFHRDVKNCLDCFNFKWSYFLV